MRVLHLAPAAGSGIADYAARFRAALVAAGHEVDLLADADATLGGVRAYVRGAAAAAADADAVHLELGGGGLGAFHAGLRLVRAGRIPVLATLHDPPRALWAPLTTAALSARRWRRGGATLVLDRPSERLDERLLRGLDHAFVLTGTGRDAVLARFPALAPRVAVLPYAVPHFGPVPPASRDAGVLTLGVHGYWYGGKGLEVLADALRLVAADAAGRRVRVLVYGGPLPGAGAIGAAVRALADRTPGMVLCGHVPEARLAAALRAVDAVVLPYGQPRRLPGLASASAAAFDALAAGVPVVASRTRGFPTLVDDGRDGVLVAPDDPSALAAVVRTLRDDPAALARLRGGAAKRAAQLAAADPAAAWLQAAAPRAAQLA